MPTYEYKCENCDHTMEVFQSITASPKKKCPVCKRMKLQRLVGAGSGIIFKGSGFYETDYRKKTPPAKETSPKKKDEKKEK